jgi:hypothetical protein
MWNFDSFNKPADTMEGIGISPALIKITTCKNISF